VRIINLTLRQDGVWGSGGIAPSFLASALNGSELSVTQYRRLDRFQIRSARYGEVQNIFTMPGIEPRLLGRPARSLIAIPTELSLARITMIHKILVSQNHNEISETCD
jgi:hypothetical protein